MSRPTPITPSTPLTVDAANAVVQGLRGDHATLLARRDGIAKSREELAAGALIDGRADSKAALAELNAAAVSVVVEIENLEAAIRAAELRLQAAQVREAQANEILKAQKARELLAVRLELAQAAQESLDRFNEKMGELINAGREMRRLTDRAASDRHDGLCLRTTMQLARCDLHRRGLLSSEPLPDERMRHPLPELIGHIDLGAKRWADVTIDGSAEERNAA